MITTYTVVELTLPFPPEELQPNTRVDRRVKARAVRAYKHACWLMVRSAMVRLGLSGPLRTPVRAEVVFVVRNRRRDVDNCLAAFKSGLDAIVAAGLLTGDNSKQLVVVPSIVSGTKQEVRVTLAEAAG